ncbi:dihydroorotase, mitochondrial-like protein isoform X2 [Tanacetum coccineum]
MLTLEKQTSELHCNAEPLARAPTRLHALNFGDLKRAKGYGVRMELSIAQPDDWHLHLRDGELLETVVSHSAKQFGRAIIMPNLKPPVTTTAAAVSYRDSILKALQGNTDFTPLMTLYLTDKTSPDEIKLARESGVVYGVKLYPAGATTNSQDGVTDLFGKCAPVLEEMVNQNMPLLVHGEVTDPEIDIFDRERVFIDTVLKPLIQKFPRLKVVMEHVTTMDAVKFVESCDEGHVAATVTPQHLLLNRNSIFQGGLQPHNYCLPVLKRETHRQAIVAAVTSGNKRFFLGTDSAPHDRLKKECACGCAGVFNAPVALSVYAKVFEELIAHVMRKQVDESVGRKVKCEDHVRSELSEGDISWVAKGAGWAGALDKLEAFTSFNGPDFYGLPRNTRKVTLKRTAWKVPESYSYASGSIDNTESLKYRPYLGLNDTETLRGIQPVKGTQLSSIQGLQTNSLGQQITVDIGYMYWLRYLAMAHIEVYEDEIDASDCGPEDVAATPLLNALSSIASATTLVAAHCVEVAEAMGTEREHLIAVVNANSHGDIRTLAAAAAIETIF